MAEMVYRVHVDRWPDLRPTMGPCGRRGRMNTTAEVSPQVTLGHHPPRCRRTG